jgi:hypothetical protein
MADRRKRLHREVAELHDQVAACWVTQARCSGR